MKPQMEYLLWPSPTGQPSLSSPPALMPLLWSHSVLVNNHCPVSSSVTVCDSVLCVIVCYGVTLVYMRLLLSNGSTGEPEHVK